jgi:alanyl-tRNA synthetase
MLINDGVIPGPRDQRYVLRRIIRRAIRYGTKLTSHPEVGFLSNVVAKIIPILDETFANKDHIVKVVKSEEEKFSGTLKDGMIFFNKLLKCNELTADNMFKLYTTFGLILFKNYVKKTILLLILKDITS